jgi:hypothetical protein
MKSPKERPANRMRLARASLRLGLLLLTASCAVAFANPARGQQSQKDKAAKAAKRFAGVWKATFEDKHYDVLELAADGSKVSGTLSPGQVMLDEQNGEVNAVGDEPSPEAGQPIIEPEIDGDKLTFKWHEAEEGSETVQYIMELSGEDEAELRFLKPPTMSDGQALPAPVKLKREKESDKPAEKPAADPKKSP